MGEPDMNQIGHERRIRPATEDADILAAAATPLDAGVNETTESGFENLQPVAMPLMKPPFTAEGAQVYDARGKQIALCGASGGVPYDVRCEMAKQIAHSLTQTVKLEPTGGPRTSDAGPKDPYCDNNGEVGCDPKS